MNQKLKALKLFIEQVVREAVEEEKFFSDLPVDRSNYYRSMVNQLKRSRDLEDVRWMTQQHDIILDLLQLPTAEALPRLKNQEPFTKFHYRKARQDAMDKVFDPTNTVPGRYLLNQEMKRREAERLKNRQAAVTTPYKTPAQIDPKKRAEAELRAVYGGEPKDTPWGLGS